MNAEWFLTSGILLALSTGLLVAQPLRDSLALVDEGKQLFETYCSPCHGVHREIVGPMLASITRKRSREWLSRFIRDSQTVIDSGDVYASYLFRSYNQQVMPSFRMLSQENITAILQYIEAESFTHVDETPGYASLNERSNASILHGHALFRDQCSSCHFIHYEGRYAPALGSVSRRHPRSWLIPFIRNSQTVIAGGDLYAKRLFETYHQRVMVPMEFLTEKDVDDILQYITFVSGSPPAAGGVNGRKVHAIQPDTTVVTPPVQAYSPKSMPFFRTLFIVIGGIVAVLYALLLARVFRYLREV